MSIVCDAVDDLLALVELAVDIATALDEARSAPTDPEHHALLKELQSLQRLIKLWKPAIEVLQDGKVRSVIMKRLSIAAVHLCNGLAFMADLDIMEDGPQIYTGFPPTTDIRTKIKRLIRESIKRLTWDLKTDACTDQCRIAVGYGFICVVYSLLVAFEPDLGKLLQSLREVYDNIDTLPEQLTINVVAVPPTGVTDLHILYRRLFESLGSVGDDNNKLEVFDRILTSFMAQLSACLLKCHITAPGRIPSVSSAVASDSEHPKGESRSISIAQASASGSTHNQGPNVSINILGVNNLQGSGKITTSNNISSSVYTDAHSVRMSKSIANIERMVSEQHAHLMTPSAALQQPDSPVSPTGRGMASALGALATFLAGVSVGAVGARYMGPASPPCPTNTSSLSAPSVPSGSVNPRLLPGGLCWILHMPVASITYSVSHGICFGQDATPHHLQPVLLRSNGESIAVVLVLPCGFYQAAAATVGDLLQRLSSILCTPMNPAQLAPDHLERASRALRARSASSSAPMLQLVDLLGPNAAFAGLSKTVKPGVYVVNVHPPLS